MRLIRLQLEHWRGVTSEAIDFDAHVTLIQGPNEIGKSSLVEALTLLFRELDSSKKTAVKAVQPVGEDVGSSVSAEIETGCYRFIYKKTFNRRPATELRILAPEPKQLTGREAHERARQMMEETFDTGLWHALQIEQGKEIVQAALRDSQGLSRALDAAAGQDNAGGEDPVLLERARDEFLKYFTEAQAKAKFKKELEEVSSLEARVAKTAEALEKAEADVASHQRLSAEMEKLQRQLPGLEQDHKQREKQWQAVAALQGQAELAQRESQNFDLQTAEASRRQSERKSQIEQLAHARAELQRVETDIEPLAAQKSDAKFLLDEKRTRLEDARKEYREAQESLRRAREEAAQLARVEELAMLRGRLERLAAVRADKQTAAAQLANARVDEAALTSLRAAEATYRERVAALEAAIPKVRITAHNEVNLGLGPEKRKLTKGEAFTPDAAEPLQIRIADLATISIEPAVGVADLRAEVVAAEDQLNGLFDEYGVKSVSDAITVNEARRDAEAKLQGATELEKEHLAGVTEEELLARRDELAASTDGEKEGGDRTAPANRTDAAKAVEDAERSVTQAERAAQQAQEDVEAANDIAQAVSTKLLLAEQGRDSRRTRIDQLTTAIEVARKSTPDSELDRLAEDAAKKAEDARAHADQLSRQLEAASPDAIQVLRENARYAVERAQTDLHNLEKELAGVSARLEQTQAQGLFEQLSKDEGALEEQRRVVEQLQRRAAAAKRLWETLQRHRNEARQAYMRPLRERVEQLGQIVFGTGLVVDIDDNLTIQSRSLNGKTVPFEGLSGGAREQLGIVTRLAAAQLVADDGAIPLIFDDVLGHSDPDRLQTMGALLARAGQTSQIIIATCDPDRYRHVGTAKVVRLPGAA
ncbi:MAG TPA: AAA family ATPase [Gammaproteobacteria bacterium]|nr:AAA family ATPase [Gammaproteobacteria bacterium]